MLKRMICLILALVTVFSLTGTAMAANGDPVKDALSAAAASARGEKAGISGDFVVYYDGNVVPADAAPAASLWASGRCGASLSWYLYYDGSLEITGSGSMYDYTLDNPAPWYNYAGYIDSIELSSGVTSVGDFAFMGCEYLTAMYIPNNTSLKRIGTWAFFGLDLGNGGWFSIPSSVTTLEDGAFAGVVLSEFKVGSTRYFTTVGGVLYNADKTKLIQYPPLKAGSSFTIPSTVTRVCDYAFLLATDLTSVSLPSKLKTIGEGAFALTLLSSVSIPASVTSIEVDAFYYCEYLRQITVNNASCKIAASKDTLGVPGRTVVRGYTGSTAESYAKKYGYSFSSLGNSKNGLVTENGKTYYYVNGVKQTGIKTVNGKTYYFSAKDGSMLKGGWVNAGGGKYYYCAADGHIMKGGMLTVKGQKYYVDKNGVRKTGFVTDKDGKTYYFSAKDGHLMKGGWVNAGNGKYYYLSAKDGHVMKNGILTVNGKKYLLDKDGARLTGPQAVNGNLYYFDSKDGHMLTNCWVEIYGRMAYADENGIIHV